MQLPTALFVSAMLLASAGNAIGQTRTSTATLDEKTENLLEEENLLGADQPVGGDKAEDASLLEGFAAELRSLGAEPTLSGYGDLTFDIDPDNDKFDIDQGHFNIVLGALLGPHARAEAELEYEHGGREIKLEYAIFELLLHRLFNLRLGKYMVPIGRFNGPLHPSFRWNQVSRPLMFKDVVPAVWSDTGAHIFGRYELGQGNSLSYVLYMVKGLAQAEGLDLTAETNPIRELRSDSENNMDKSFGGQVELHLLQGRAGETRVGVSGYTGRFDAAETMRLSILDAHFSLKIDELLFRGELAQSFLNGDSHEFGVYLQAAYTLGWFTFAGRWDLANERPGLGNKVRKMMFAPSIMMAPSTFWSLRCEVDVPVQEGGTVDPPKVLLMVAFGF